MPAILVTGASTGIGEACALHLSSLGHRVFAGVRKAADGERLEAGSAANAEPIVPVTLDVTDAATIEQAVATVRSQQGSMRFAGLVNNAGVARGGPLEYLDIEEWRDQIEVNVIGQVAVTKACLPLVREGSGRIVFIGSIGGRVGTPLMGPYCASKFAIEGIAEALRHELHDAGIKVALVEPGVIKTAIWGKGKETTERLLADATPEMVERYGLLIERVVKGIDRNSSGGVEPIVVAEVVEHALFAERPRARYLVGSDAKVAAVMARFVPDHLRDRLVRSFG